MIESRHLITHEDKTVTINEAQKIKYIADDLRVYYDTPHKLHSLTRVDTPFIYQDFIDLTEEAYFQLSLVYADLDEIIMIANIFKLFEENKERLSIDVLEQIEVLLQQGY